MAFGSVPITPKIARVADLMEEGIQKYLRRRDKMNLGPSEVYKEACRQIIVNIRNIQGAITLVRTDLALYLPALVIARASYENGVRVLWMLAPDDPVERGLRWLCRYQDHARFWAQMAERYKAEGRDPLDSQERHDQLMRTVRTNEANIKAEFGDKYQLYRSTPNLADMLASLGRPDLYPIYKVISLFAHSSLETTGIFENGVASRLKDAQPPETYWYNVFLPCWFGLMEPIAALSVRIGFDSARIFSLSYLHKVKYAMGEIRPR